MSSPENETGESFDYWCRASDLEYWLSNNLRAVLIVSKPSSNEAYWVPIQQCFAEPARRGSNRITFLKAEQPFTKDSLEQLLRVAVLLELIMRRYERVSTLLTSNRPVDDWGKLLGDTAAVTALLDRLLHHAHVLKCGPRSWRTKVQTDLRTDEGTK